MKINKLPLIALAGFLAFASCIDFEEPILQKHEKLPKKIELCDDFPVKQFEGSPLLIEYRFLNDNENIIKSFLIYSSVSIQLGPEIIIDDPIEKIKDPSLKNEVRYLEIYVSVKGSKYWNTIIEGYCTYENGILISFHSFKSY